MNVTRPTIMEIDLNAFEHNVNEIQKYVGDNVKIMPILKANAYGTQVNTLLNVINKFDIVGVAFVDEGVTLREIGYKKEIFILNQPYENEIENIIRYNLTIGISSSSFVDELGKSSNDFFVHIEIGTGMGRTGINPYKVKAYIEKIKEYNNIKIEGIYTHLSSADIDEEYTEKQLHSFEVAINEANEMSVDFKYIHAGASNGIINFKNSHYNLVRPGIILYGYKAAEDTYDRINIKPVAKLKSKITLLKTVKENTSIGYGRSFITTRETKIATIPIGYADGYMRSNSNKGYVLINGKKAPVIGNVCMDGIMADVTDLEDVKLWDDVYIWDNDNITVEEIAELNGTINHEILSTVSYRVPRKFEK